METAADLCAETFAAAFAQRSRFRDTGTSARPWLYASPATSWATTCAAGGSPTATGAASASSPRPSPEELERVEELVDGAVPGRHQDALAQLPASLADAVVLRIGEDLAYPDVAAPRLLGGRSPRPVSRGLNRLADLMEER